MYSGSNVLYISCISSPQERFQHSFEQHKIVLFFSYCSIHNFFCRIFIYHFLSSHLLSAPTSKRNEKAFRDIKRSLNIQLKNNPLKSIFKQNSAAPCSNKEWRCFSRECIDRRLLCDRKPDCKDASDETYTHAGCVGSKPLHPQCSFNFAVESLIFSVIARF